MKKINYISTANKAAAIQLRELKKIKKVFNRSFVNAVDLIINCKGKIIFSGVGKNSFICKKAAHYVVYQVFVDLFIAWRCWSNRKRYFSDHFKFLHTAS